MKIPPPVAELVGLEVVSSADGEVVMALDVEERHGNPMGFVQGGVICVLADGAMGYAFALTLADGESFTTVEMKTNFLRPFVAGRLLATGRVLNRGRTLGLTEAHVRDEQGRLIAHATSTCMALRPAE
ncbi:MAG TPA: PaaI family thioesterase [Gaiellaceae bacterium]|nr:PaaI family thioesterase [Gaiellaceae bacterium]